MQSIHIVNGPNLNLVGHREPHVYGTVGFEDWLEELKRDYTHLEIYYFQSNHEGEILDYLHQWGFDKNTGFVLNAGGLAHTSVVLRDAVSAIEVPVVEVHISDIYKREPFRWHSYLTEVCVAHFIGYGMEGYRMGIDLLAQNGHTLTPEDKPAS